MKLSSTVSVIILSGIISDLLRSRGSDIIQAQGIAMQGMMRALTGGTPVVDTRSSAERFHEKALTEIGEYWRGFGTEWNTDEV